LINLLQAEASPSQRRNLLQELFADIALEIDDRAKGIYLILHRNLDINTFSFCSDAARIV